MDKTTHCAVTVAEASGPLIVLKWFEAESGMPWIARPVGEGAISLALRGLWKVVIKLPKIRRGE